jgi:hypothetical protein
MPVKKRVSKKPRASKSSRSSSRVMKRTQRKGKSKKTRTVKRRKQKAGAASVEVEGKDLKKIIKLTADFYNALKEHIEKFECGSDSKNVKENMPGPITSPIFISIEDHIGLITDIDPSKGVESNKTYTVDPKPKLWKPIISFINTYFDLLLPFDKNGIQSVGSEGNADIKQIKAQLQASISAFGETCDIKPVAESDPAPDFLTKLKNFCKFKKVSTRGEHELLECERE